MADPLRHHSKLDIAEEILEFIAKSPDAEEIREIVRSLLELTDSDLEDANEVVSNISNLIKEQEF